MFFINLISAYRRERERLRRVFRLLVGLCGGLFVLLVLLVVSSLRGIYQAKSQIQATRQAIQALQPKHQEVLRLRQIETDMKPLLQPLEESENNINQWLRVMGDLAQSLPEDTVIQSISFSPLGGRRKPTVTVQLLAQTYESIVRTTLTLKEKPTVEEVNLQQMAASPEGYNFSLVATLATGG